LKSTSTFKKIRIIRNPKSGIVRSQNLVKKSIDLTLVQAPFDYDYFETEYQGHASELAKEAVQENYDAVIAVGGDGTMNEIASQLVFTDTALGLIPLGSGNGLAISMGIPLTPLRAARLLMQGQIKTIDAARIDEHLYFIVAGMGFDAIIGKEFNKQETRGLLPYFKIGFQVFSSYKPEVFILKFNDKQIAVPALFVVIANQKGWGGGAKISPDAKPDDGLLDICAIHRAPAWYVLLNLPRLFFGNIEKMRRYVRYQAKSVEIIREKAGPVTYDGEIFDGPQVLKSEILPQALKMIVPFTENLDENEEQ